MLSWRHHGILVSGDRHYSEDLMGEGASIIRRKDQSITGSNQSKSGEPDRLFIYISNKHNRAHNASNCIVDKILQRKKSPTIEWLNAHAMNRTYAVRALAISILVILHLLIDYCGLYYVIGSNQDSAIRSFIMIATPLLTCIEGAVLMLYFKKDSVRGKMGQYYTSYARYVEKGPFYFLLHDLKGAFLLEVKFVGMFCGYVVAGACSMAVWLSVIALPFVAIALSLKGLYRIATRKNHWICLGVTTIVTIVVAFKASPYVGSNGVAMCATALSAGGAAVVCTDLTRSLLFQMFRKVRFMRAIAVVPISESLKPTYRIIDWWA